MHGIGGTDRQGRGPNVTAFRSGRSNQILMAASYVVSLGHLRDSTTEEAATGVQIWLTQDEMLHMIPQ